MRSDKELAARLQRVVSLVVAASIIVVSVLILVFERPSHESSTSLILGLTANALFSGSVTVLVFSWLSSQQAEQQMNFVLDRVLREVFLPLRSAIEEVAVSGYHWSTHFTAPTHNDPLPECAVQLINLSYVRRTLPDHMFVVCIASLDDSVLDELDGPDRYLMRWQVEDRLDPSATEVFIPLSVKVDDIEIVPKVRTIWIRGCRACEYRYSIPRAVRARSRNRVELAVATRKLCTDSQVTVKARIFSTVVDSEFSCTIDSSIRCRRLSVAANVTGLGPRGEMSVGSTYAPAYGAVAAHARFAQPLQAGTSITFYIDREQAPAELPAVKVP